jgi:3-oxoacyl-[acyl-carrier-protein] synthase-3
LDYIRITRNADVRATQEAALYSNADMAAKAAALALSRAGIEAKDIGLVIAGGCTPQYLIPAEASTFAKAIGVNCPTFDLNAACSSFAAQVHHIGMMRPEALPGYILVVNAEGLTRATNYADRASAVLFGDASSAAVISVRHPARVQISYTAYGADPSNWEKVIIPAGGHFTQDGSAVQGFAIRRGTMVINELCEATGQTKGELKFIGHQANLLMLQSLVTRSKLTDALHLYNVDTRGNCGAAGAPTVLSENWDLFEPGDRLALAVVGSGLSWGGLLVEFGDAP